MNGNGQITGDNIFFCSFGDVKKYLFFFHSNPLRIFFSRGSCRLWPWHFDEIKKDPVSHEKIPLHHCVWWRHELGVSCCQYTLSFIVWIFSIATEQKFYLAFTPEINFHTLMIPILFWISKRVSLITCFLFILNWIVAKTANTENRCVTHGQDKSLLA